jgi:thiamine kinase-like enzyme
VLRTRYKTYLDDRIRHKSFLFIHYELEIGGRETQTPGLQQVYAQAYLNGRSQLKFRQIKAPRLCQPQFGAALVHLPDLGLIVWAFPNDPHLFHLPAAVDREQIKSHLPYAYLPAGFDGPEDIAGAEVAVIRYKPEVRCTIRYHLRRKGPGTPEAVTLYGKTYATHKGKEIYSHIESLWRQSRAGPHHFTVAQPLGYDETLQLVWQEALPGLPLSNVLSPANYDHFLRLAAWGLANLHQSALVLPCQITTGHLLAEIGPSAAELMAALPEFKERLQLLLAYLERHEPGLTTLPDRLIHRDFHIKQLLVHEDNATLAIFDFDDLATGDPCQDIAFFLVDLHCRDFAPRLVAQMTTTFCQAYQSYIDRELPADRLRWHLRLQFLAKAHWYYKKKQLASRLKAHIERIIALAEKEEGGKEATHSAGGL